MASFKANTIYCFYLGGGGFPLTLKVMLAGRANVALNSVVQKSDVGMFLQKRFHVKRVSITG